MTAEDDPINDEPVADDQLADGLFEDISVIDDEGNLFGRINVIDALAILLVFAVVVAGIAVVGVGFSGGEPETRYATVDLGTQPDYIIDRLSAGDVMAIDGQNITVTDTYATPTAGASSNTTLYARVELEGVRQEGQFGDPQFVFGGEPIRPGDQLTLESTDYIVDGELTTVEPEGTELAVETTAVLTETTVPALTADAITEGDTFRVGTYTLATIRHVQPYPIGDDRYRVQVGVDLKTLQIDSRPEFAGQPVTLSSNIPMRFDTYALTGNVIERGTTTPRGETDSTTAILKLENIDPDVADGLAANMTETERGETLATVQAVSTQPAEVVLESEDGNIYGRDHPVNKDVRLRVELRTRQTASGIRFHGTSLREGERVRLNLEDIAVSGTVTRLNSS